MVLESRGLVGEWFYYEAGFPFEVYCVMEESHEWVWVLRGVRDVHISRLQLAVEESIVVSRRAVLWPFAPEDV